MRASRLVSILLLLQSRGRMTAAQLAARRRGRGLAWSRAAGPVPALEGADRRRPGADIEVLEPPALRTRLAAAARATAALYDPAEVLGRATGPVLREDADRDTGHAAGMLGGATDHGVGPGGDPEWLGDLVEQRCGVLVVRLHDELAEPG